MHTYSMKDCARERYIFYLALLAVALLAIAKQYAGFFGVAISITTVSVFAAMFFIFDHWAWRVAWLSKLVGIPNLAGQWNVTGQTNGADGQPREWTAVATIVQTWSRIAISLETDTSRSRSGMAALECDPGHGFRVVYGYANEPKGTGGELNSHRGTCEVVFSSDLTVGQATYFNDHQRRTCGMMTWKRIS